MLFITSTVHHEQHHVEYKNIVCSLSNMCIYHAGIGQSTAINLTHHHPRSPLLQFHLLPRPPVSLSQQDEQ